MMSEGGCRADGGYIRHTREGAMAEEVMAEVTKAVFKMFVEYFNRLC